MKKRFTRKNSNGSYRVPLESAGEFRLLQTGSSQGIFGDLINRLGDYEDNVPLDELNALKRKKNNKP